MIAPSILSANFAELGKDLKDVLDAEADIIHFDVMDNHYVPNLTFGPMVCQALRNYGITAPIDIHLMAQPVDNLIIDFAKAGATYITFHPEASKHIDRSLNLIHDHGCKAGLAFNPATPIDYLDYLWEKIDIILIMSVNPGFGGQQFIPTALNKIQEIKKLVDGDPKRSNILIEVDGGINLNNYTQIVKAGADILVMGSAIFNYPGKYQEIINTIKHYDS